VGCFQRYVAHSAATDIFQHCTGKDRPQSKKKWKLLKNPSLTHIPIINVAQPDVFDLDGNQTEFGRVQHEQTHWIRKMVHWPRRKRRRTNTTTRGSAPFPPKVLFMRKWVPYKTHHRLWNRPQCYVSTKVANKFTEKATFSKRHKLLRIDETSEPSPSSRDGDTAMHDGEGGDIIDDQAMKDVQGPVPMEGVETVERTPLSESLLFSPQPSYTPLSDPSEVSHAADSPSPFESPSGPLSHDLARLVLTEDQSLPPP
jgi:hypothetical protein